MRKRIYLAIAAALKEARAAATVGLWNETLLTAEGAAPPDYPAVYVEFLPVKWHQRGGGLKSAAAELNLHILTDGLTEAGTPLSTAETLSALDAVDEVVGVVQGLGGEGFGRFQHSSTVPDHTGGPVIHDVEGFVYEAADDCGMRSRACMEGAKGKIIRG